MNKILFTPGPVQMDKSILNIGSIQTPYFRNAEFSSLILECEENLLSLVNASYGSRAIFLSGSGTLAMEAAVTNFMGVDSVAAVINGGSFGERFVKICKTHNIATIELLVDRDDLSSGSILDFDGHVSALLTNVHETSVGHVYSLDSIKQFCLKKRCLNIVDAISYFVTDFIDVSSSAIDVLILSSHKGLGLPPGLSVLVLSERAVEMVGVGNASFYLNLGEYLGDGLRGQTPFTPSIQILMQLRERLKQINSLGLDHFIDHAKNLAEYFRAGIRSLPLAPYSKSMPNAMTAVELLCNMPASLVVERLAGEYGCIVAPNGGNLKNSVFRVSHMGALEISHYDHLLNSLKNIFRDG